MTKVFDYATGYRLDGNASPELFEESAGEPSGTGAVPAYRDDAGVWQYVEPSQEDFFRRVRGERVITVWVELH